MSKHSLKGDKGYKMNNTEKQFIELLSKSIRNDKKIKKYEEVNWGNLVSLAGEHKVEGVIYSTIKENASNLGVNNIILDELKTFTFYTAISEIRKISFLDNIFKKFHDENISVIALKGLVLRNFYPEPDQRSMCDADVLVNKEDLKRITELLKSIDYELESEDEKFHLKFTHRMYPMIEVHWSLVEGEELDNSIWENTVKSKLINTEIITLGNEDFLLHLCQHMIHHMTGMGFGLRQLADLVLFTEANRDLINWNNFKNKSKEQGIEKFVLIIFGLCKNLFDMDIPDILVDRDIIYSPNMDLFIEDILLGGVYGRSNNEKMLANSIVINTNQNDDNPVISMAKKIKSVLNPSDETLVGKYSYASKFKLLKPFAGVQQIYHSRFNEDYGFVDNVKFIYKGIKMSKDRNNLIRWLGI